MLSSDAGTSHTQDVSAKADAISNVFIFISLFIDPLQKKKETLNQSAFPFRIQLGQPFIPVMAIPLMNCFWKIINTMDAGIMISAEAAMVADRSV